MTLFCLNSATKLAASVTLNSMRSAEHSYADSAGLCRTDRVKNPLSVSFEGRRLRTSRQERQEWITACEADVQPQEDFAGGHGLKVGTFRSWIRRQSRPVNETVPMGSNLDC
jgi:hypothetical protein